MITCSLWELCHVEDIWYWVSECHNTNAGVFSHRVSSHNWLAPGSQYSTLIGWWNTRLTNQKPVSWRDGIIITLLSAFSCFLQLCCHSSRSTHMTHGKTKFLHSHMRNTSCTIYLGLIHWVYIIYWASRPRDINHPVITWSNRITNKIKTAIASRPKTNEALRGPQRRQW